MKRILSLIILMAAVMTMAAQNSTENRHYCVDLGLPSGTL